MVTHSSIFAWRILWTEEPGGLQSMGFLRVGHDWVTFNHSVILWNARSILAMKNQVKVKVAQSCLTLCDRIDCSLPGSSVHGILHAKILEWVTISFCRGSSWCRDQTRVSRIAGGFFTVWATRENIGYIHYVVNYIFVSYLFYTYEFKRNLFFF